MSLIFIEIHTDAMGCGAGGNEIVPSGWYSVSEAIDVLKAARKVLKAIRRTLTEKELEASEEQS